MKKFSDYILGAKVELLTDHKPLVNILGMKPISELSARLQRFRMRLMRFTYNIKHVPGRELYTADTLSRDPQKYDHNEADVLFEKNMDLYVRAVEAATPIGDALLQKIRETQGKDSTSDILKNYIRRRWPVERFNNVWDQSLCPSRASTKENAGQIPYRTFRHNPMHQASKRSYLVARYQRGLRI